jgi:hypothetical protein
MIMITWVGVPMEWMITYLIMGLLIGDQDDKKWGITYLILGLVIRDHDDIKWSTCGVRDNLSDPWTHDQ